MSWYQKNPLKMKNHLIPKCLPKSHFVQWLYLVGNIFSTCIHWVVYKEKSKIVLLSIMKSSFYKTGLCVLLWTSFLSPVGKIFCTCINWVVYEGKSKTLLWSYLFIRSGLCVLLWTSFLSLAVFLLHQCCRHPRQPRCGLSSIGNVYWLELGLFYGGYFVRWVMEFLTHR